jgi:hypothetical protein
MSFQTIMSWLKLLPNSQLLATPAEGEGLTADPWKPPAMNEMSNELDGILRAPKKSTSMDTAGQAIST